MRARQGFTILELIIVLAIGSILASVVAATFGGTMDRVAVRSAQTEFLTMQAQTRSLAVERGGSVLLIADPGTNVVSLEQGCDGAGDVLITRDFAANYAVTMKTSGGTILLCMTARGYADPDQNSFANEAEIAFSRGDRSLAVTLFPLGQVVRQ